MDDRQHEEVVKVFEDLWEQLKTPEDKIAFLARMLTVTLELLGKRKQA